MRSKVLLAPALIVLVAATLAPARADADQPRTIVVSGEGEVAASPDIANLSFAIETHAKTAAEATTANAALAQKVTAALKAKIGGKGRISTGGYSLTPDYEQHQGRQNPTIIGYNAQNSITVETPAMSLLGDLIDSAVAAGANRVNYLNFTLKNDGQARAEALAAASRDAQMQAQALAASLNVKLKRILTASTGSAPHPVPLERGFAMAAKMSAPTPIEPGQVTVSATVSLTYEIE